MESIRITLPSGKATEVPVRTRTGEVIIREKLDATPAGKESPVVATLINNELTSLSYRLEVNAALVPYPTAFVIAIGIMVCPVHHPTFGVPFILAEKFYRIPFP